MGFSPAVRNSFDLFFLQLEIVGKVFVMTATFFSKLYTKTIRKVCYELSLTVSISHFIIEHCQILAHSFNKTHQWQTKQQWRNIDL